MNTSIVETPDAIEAQVLKDRILGLMAGWSPKEKASEWTVDQVADFYELDDNFLAMDTVIPTRSVILGGQTFKGDWESEVTNMKSFRCDLDHIVAQKIYMDSAWTGLVFRTQFQPKDGDAVDMLIQLTLVWEKIAGKWKIVHEHLSTPVRM